MKGFAVKRAGREGFAAVGHSDAASRTEVSLGCLDRDVFEQELDLLPFYAEGFVAPLSIRIP